jgi:hypothetical protein
VNIAFSGSRRMAPNRAELDKARFDALRILRCDVELSAILVGDCFTGTDKAVMDKWNLRKNGEPSPIVYMAQWDQFGMAAGPIRNQVMIDDADALVAFPCPQSKGTWDAIRKAVKKGIPVVIIPLGAT